MGQPHPSRTIPPQPAASRTTTNARTHPPSGEQRVLRHVPFLAHSNATALIGPPTNPTTAAPWSRIYRGLDHTTARRALQSNRQEFSIPARRFTDAFVDLQQLRHSADYEPNAVFTAIDGAMHLDRAESAILGFTQITLDERLHIATITLVRSR